MASIISLLPFAFKILGFFLNLYGASDATMKQFIALVNSAHGDGLIPIQQRDNFVSQREKILAKIREREQAPPPAP